VSKTALRARRSKAVFKSLGITEGDSSDIGRQSGFAPGWVRAIGLLWANEEAEVVEIPKTASPRSGKKSGPKRAPAKEHAVAEELGIVDDQIPF
jgi:hypothetical protein